MIDINLLKTLKVLYVEDEIMLRDTTYTSLNSILKEVVVADNGKIGFEKFSNETFDLIITDLSMPIMSGIDMIHKIREVDSQIPILITSAYGSQNEDLNNLMKIGINDYVMKPVDIMELVEKIHKVVTTKI